MLALASRVEQTESHQFYDFSCSKWRVLPEVNVYLVTQHEVRESPDVVENHSNHEVQEPNPVILRRCMGRKFSLMVLYSFSIVH